MSAESDFKMFKWVPDGTYDYDNFLTRYVIVNGNPTVVISKAWVDNGGPVDVSAELKQTWGSFPDIPPKPAKK
jgi:hypothetical protein